MAQEINIKLNVQTGDANQTVGQFKVNIEQVGDAVDKTVQKTSKMNSSLSSTSKRIKGLGLENASRGIERLGTGFSSLKLSNITSGFRMLGAAIASNPIGAIATAVLALVSAFGGLDGIMKSVTGSFNSMAEAQKATVEMQDKAIENFAKEKVALDNLFKPLNDVTLTSDERRIIIEEVNNKYGEYLPNMLTEKSTAEEIAAAYDLVNDSLVRKALTEAKTQAVTAATTKLLKDQQEAMRKMAESQAIIDEQRARGIKKVSQGARDDIERQKKNLIFIEKEYNKTLDLIDQASKDLEGKLLKNIDTSTKKVVDKKKSTNKQVALSSKNTEDDILKAILARYEAEIDKINDTNLEKKNLLKKELNEALITEEEYNKKLLLLTKSTDEELLQLSQNFTITDTEKKKLKVESDLLLKEKLNDDILKAEGKLQDDIIALNKNNDAAIKKYNEDRAKEEAERKEKEAKELQAKISKIEKEFTEDKTELLRKTNLTEIELAQGVLQAEIDKNYKLLALYNKDSEERSELLLKIAELEKKLIDDASEYRSKKTKEDLEKTKKSIKEYADAGINLANQGLSAFSAIADAQFEIRKKGLREGSKEEEAAAKRDFETRKKISIASAVISGIEGLVNVWTAKSTIPQPFDAIYKGVQSAFIVATTAANIAKIKATQFKGSTPPTTETPPSGGGAPTETPTFQPTQFFGLGQTTPGLGGQEQGPTRVYVTEGDISNTQNRVRVVENRARFG